MATDYKISFECCLISTPHSSAEITNIIQNLLIQNSLPYNEGDFKMISEKSPEELMVDINLHSHIASESVKHIDYQAVCLDVIITDIVAIGSY